MPQPIDVLVVTRSGSHCCDEALRLFDEVAESSGLPITPVPSSAQVSRDFGMVGIFGHAEMFVPAGDLPAELDAALES